jgi:hypothetical protein
MGMTPQESYDLAMASIDENPVDDTPVDEPQGGEQQQPTGFNPAWEEAWKDVPDPIREQQRPFFEKMDRDYQELQARYTPYREFEQSGVLPERLQTAMQIQDALVEDPHAFWVKMAESWGFDRAQSNALANAATDDTDDSDLTPAELRLRNRLQALEQQELARSQQYQQSYADQQQQAFVASETQRVNDDLAALKAKVGNFNEELVVQWALKNATIGGNPSVEVAYYELQKYNEQVLASQQRRSPRVLGSGGQPAIQQQAEPAKPLTDEDRLKRAMSLAKQMAGSQ